MRIMGAWVALGVSCLAATASAPPGFYLHDGDTVVFYGDSITSQLLYSIYTEAYVSARFPQLRVRFVHSGWSGDRVSGGARGGAAAPAHPECTKRTRTRGGAATG